MSVPRYGSKLDTPEPEAPKLAFPSRGPPPEMQQLGIITHERCSEVFGLFGRRAVSGRARWEYYYEPGQGSSGRVPLCTPPHIQLYTGDNVKLPGKAGVWKVSLYRAR